MSKEIHIDIPKINSLNLKPLNIIISINDFKFYILECINKLNSEYIDIANERLDNC